jgi:hypothetical protein
VSVKVVAGPVVAHRCARVGVPGGDLDIAQVDACIEHGGHASVPKHVRVHPRQPDARSAGEPAEPTGSRVAVHPRAASVQQQRSCFTVAAGAVNGPTDGWWQRDEDDLPAFAAHANDAVSVLLAQVVEANAGCLEHPQPE